MSRVKKGVVLSDDESPMKVVSDDRKKVGTPASESAWADNSSDLGYADDITRKRVLPNNKVISKKVITLLDDDDDDDLDPPKKKSRKPIKPKASKKEKVASDSDGDDDGSGDDYADHEFDEQSCQSMAEQVLKQCESFSSSLRAALSDWEENALGASSMSPSRRKKPNGECVRLTSIASSSTSKASGQVLSQDDISACCTNLVLKEYQLVGVNWIRLLHANPPVNGVLADDMGLGKTIQTIAFLGWLKAYNVAQGVTCCTPHLIIVPASTLANWEKEISLYLPEFSIAVYHGSQDERAELRRTLRGDIDKGIIDIVLCTYTIFEKEASGVDRAFIKNRQFDYLILDEAHCLKNSNNSRFQNLNQIKPHHRLLLSGTPVQNNANELLTLLEFLMPSVFGRGVGSMLGYVFQNESKGGSKKKGAVGGSTQDEKQQQTLSQLRAMLAPFVLRRLKTDVLNQLVEKKVISIQVEQSEFQRKLYESILLNHGMRREQQKEAAARDLAMARLLEDSIKSKSKLPKTSKPASSNGQGTLVLTNKSGHVVDLTSPNTSPDKPTMKNASIENKANQSTENDESAAVQIIDDVDPHLVSLAASSIKNLSDKDARHLFTALRKAASHPLLLRVRYQDEQIMQEVAKTCFCHDFFGNQTTLERVREELDTFSDFDIHQICCEFENKSRLGQYKLQDNALYDSPKMQKLMEMLPALVADGHHILIFSQWTRIMDLLEELMRDLGIAYLRLDGSTPVRERQQLIDIFSEGQTPVFILSTKAGGLGINLTQADTVILHDLDFNPENDRQAEDRAHRIGQTRPVNVYKMYVKGTVEEDIYSMGVRKMKLSDAVLSNTKGSAGKGEKGDIGHIGRILQQSIKRLSGAEADPEVEAQAQAELRSAEEKLLLKQEKKVASAIQKSQAATAAMATATATTSAAKVPEVLTIKDDDDLSWLNPEVTSPPPRNDSTLSTQLAVSNLAVDAEPHGSRAASLPHNQQEVLAIFD